MIVKVSSWTKNPQVKAFCEQLLEIDGTKKKSTPQRCEIHKGRDLLASIGFEGKATVIEFMTDKKTYAIAHGAKFIKPHPMQQMAGIGWLQGRPENDEQFAEIIEWIKVKVKN